MSLSKINLIIDNSELINDRETVYQSDIWELEAAGIKTVPYITTTHISFKKINPEWLRKLAKRFIRYQAATKVYYTIQQYIRSIVHFSNFLSTYNRIVQPQDINRTLMLSYIEYVHNLPGVNEAKNKLITHIKLMMTLASIENWENITKEKIMFREDRLPVRRGKPRYIPNIVLDQLNKYIDDLLPDLRRFVVILQHTGRRPGEICALPLNCLIRDSEGDYFLRYYEFKMKKEETIPISHEIASVIKEQQEWITIQHKSNEIKYLFTNKKYGPIQPYIVSNALNQLGIKHSIKGLDNNLWHFQLHQFRHTVGTRMINAGMPAHIVQRYLKHNSPEMTMNYAYLHDSTMKAEFAKFHGKMVDITGKVIHEQENIEVAEDLKWLKRNILAQSLPNGYCGLPIQQGGCPHANACLGCSHFRTTTQFMDQHKRQLEETKKILNTAVQYGWSRQIEMNKKVESSLLAIISTLEKQ